MARANDLWMEFLGGTLPCPNCHCGLCGNSGIVDTVGIMYTPAGHPCGVREYTTHYNCTQCGHGGEVAEDYYRG